MKSKTRNPLRCECSSKHLLAFYGVNQAGDIYVHVMSHKQGRPLSNVVIFGDCEIQCPACYRWHSLTVRRDGKLDRYVNLDPPAEIAESETVVRANST